MALADLGLLDFIPACSPHLRRPDHLAEWATMIERCSTETVRGLCSIPTRHHKTVTTLHGVIWLLKRHPDWRIMLMAHEHRRAQWMGTQTRIIRERAGIAPVRGQDTLADWSTAEGGGVIVIGAGQSGLGADARVFIADDPIDENGFGDPSVRDAVDDAIAFYTSRAGGDGTRGSVLIVMSRGDLDDPIGRRLIRTGWEYSFGQAILGEGTPDERAFAEDVWPLEELKKNRAEMAEKDPSLRVWESQWMNNPLAHADGFFEGQTAYVGEPPHGAEKLFGVDFAFTQGKKSDYFAAVGMTVDAGRYPVFEVHRHRRGLSQAIETCERIHERFPDARFVTYTSGPEIGVYHQTFELTQGRICIETMPARWNKATRASKTAQAWRAGTIPVRLGQPWTGAFLAELHSFNGSEVGVDDQVDATVAAYDALMLSRPAEGFEQRFTFGSACM